jgi:hypothetical protein
MLVATVATAAVLVPAGVAQASQKRPAVSAEAEVSVHVAKAHSAIKSLKHLVGIGDGLRAEVKLVLAKKETAKASKIALRIAASAGTKGAKADAAASLIKAATQYDELLECVTDLVDEVSGEVQDLLGDSILESIVGHDEVLDVLNDLLDEVPETVQQTLASVIAALELDDATEILNLRDAAAGGDLPEAVSEIVDEALDTLIDTLDEVFDTLEDEILPLLPKSIQKPLESIVDVLDDTTEQLTPEVAETVTELVDSLLDSVPLIGDESILGADLLGDDLLGNLLGEDLLAGILGDDHNDGILEPIGELVEDLLDGVLDGHGKGGKLLGDLDLVQMLLGDKHSDGLLGGLLDDGLLGGVLGDGGHGHDDGLLSAIIGDDGLLGGVIGGDDGVVNTVTELVDSLLGGLLCDCLLG